MQAYILLCFRVGQIPNGVKFCSKIPGVIKIEPVFGVYDAVARVDVESLDNLIQRFKGFAGLIKTFCLPIKDD